MHSQGPLWLHWQLCGAGGRAAEAEGGLGSWLVDRAGDLGTARARDRCCPERVRGGWPCLLPLLAGKRLGHRTARRWTGRGVPGDWGASALKLSGLTGALLWPLISCRGVGGGGGGLETTAMGGSPGQSEVCGAARDPPRGRVSESKTGRVVGLPHGVLGLGGRRGRGLLPVICLKGCALLSRLDRQTQATTLVHQIFGGYLRSRGK